MNKLLLTLIAGGAAAAIYWQHVSLTQARAQASELADKAGDATARVAHARAGTAASKTALEQEKTRAEGFRKLLSEWDEKPEAVAEFPRSLDPGQRWSSNQPWCYLPKRDLLGYGFLTFTRQGGITDEAALLFGLSPGQRARVEDAYAEYIEGVHAIDQANLKPTSASPAFDLQLPNRRIRSYELRLSTEAIGEKRDQFEASVRAALSETQGDLFLRASDQQLSPFLYELAHPYIRLTYAQPLTPQYEGDEGVIQVEFNFPVGEDRRGDCRYLYPEDADTDVPFHHYAKLVDAFEMAQGATQKPGS